MSMLHSHDTYVALVWHNLLSSCSILFIQTVLQAIWHAPDPIDTLSRRSAHRTTRVKSSRPSQAKGANVQDDVRRRRRRRVTRSPVRIGSMLSVSGACHLMEEEPWIVQIG